MQYKMICLLCDIAILTLQKSSAHQPHATHENHKHFKFALQKLKDKNLKQSYFKLWQDLDIIPLMQFIKKLIYLSTFRSFTLCVFVKVVECLDPDKTSKYKLPLSRITITNQQHQFAQYSKRRIHI